LIESDAHFPAAEKGARDLEADTEGADLAGDAEGIIALRARDTGYGDEQECDGFCITGSDNDDASRPESPEHTARLRWQPRYLRSTKTGGFASPPAVGLPP
jgi:hypothetical protein